MKDGNTIPKIGLGTYLLKGRECRRAVKTALDLGYHHIDTAEMYTNESEIGETISEFDRSDLFITSKVWTTNLHHDDVLNACEKTLERLGTPYVDLYLIHWPNVAIPIEETLGAMMELHEGGKVRSIGVSNFTISQLEEAMELSELPITVNQVEFHPWLYQRELLNFCRGNDVVLTAYTPLGRGRILNDETLQELSLKHGKTVAQIALKWEIEKGAVPIPRSSSEGHLKENLDLFDWQLDREYVEEIDSIPVERRMVSLH